MQIKFSIKELTNRSKSSSFYSILVFAVLDVESQVPKESANNFAMVVGQVFVRFSFNVVRKFKGKGG